MCDTVEHYQVLLAIKSYENGMFTKEEAAEEIKKRGVVLGSYDGWPEGTKQKLDEILAEPKRKKKSFQIQEETENVLNDEIEISDEL